jgi:hypothetical protein
MLPFSAQNIAILKNYRNQIIMNKCRNKIIEHNNHIRNNNAVKNDDTNIWTIITTDSKWAIITTNDTCDYLYGVSNQGIYIINKSNEIIETTAPKENLWTCISTSASGQNTVACAFKDNASLFYTSNDYGNTWTNTLICLRQGYCSSIKCCQDGKFFVAITITGSLYTSNDYGITWTEGVNLGTKTYSITTNLLGQYIAVTSFDGFYISKDYGNSFSKNTNSQKFTHVDMDTTGQYIVTSTPTGTIYKSNDYGESWSIIGYINCCPKSLICDKKARKIAVSSIQKNLIWIFTSDDDNDYTCNTEPTSGIFTQLVSDNNGDLTAIMYENGNTYLTRKRSIL